jgi:hypothetical protein
VVVHHGRELGRLSHDDVRPAGATARWAALVQCETDYLDACQVAEQSRFLTLTQPPPAFESYPSSSRRWNLTIQLSPRSRVRALSWRYHLTAVPYRKNATAALAAFVPSSHDAAHGGDLQLASSTGSRTEFVLTLPLIAWSAANADMPILEGKPLPTTSTDLSADVRQSTEVL